MKFYTFVQNNSGGSFDGPHYIIVEAENADEANLRAEHVGVYFDGVDGGRDCECCGDRWHSVSERDAADQPEIYGDPAREYNHWWDGGCLIYHRDGTQETFPLLKEVK